MRLWSARRRRSESRRAADGGDVDRRRALEHHAAELAVVEGEPFGEVDRSSAEVGVGIAVLHGRGDAAQDLVADVRLQARRAHDVLPAERRDRGVGEVPLLQARLQRRMGVDAAHDRGVEPEARREGEAAAVDVGEVDLARRPVVGEAQQVLGGVDDVARDAEHLAVDVGRAAGERRQRGGGVRQAVGGLVDGAVAAEGDDHVVALLGGLAAQDGRVVAPLGVHRVDLVAALQGVDDEVLQAIGDRRRVRVDDDEHPLALDGPLQGGERVGQTLEGFDGRHRRFLHLSPGGVS